MSWITDRWNRLFDQTKLIAQASLLNELMRFFGTDVQAPRFMFPRVWPSKVRRVSEAVYGFRFLLTTLLSSRNTLLVRGPKSADMLQGQLSLVDTELRRHALTCMVTLTPFIAFRARSKSPVAAACKALGIDASDELKAYLSINALIFFFGTHKGQSVVIHVASSASGREAITRHKEGLRMAAAALSSSYARLLVPDVIFFSGAAEKREILLQTMLPGRTVKLKDASNTGYFAAIDRALEPLLQFRLITSSSDRGVDGALIFDAFPQLLQEFQEIDWVRPLLLQIQAWQRKRRFTPVLTHGDYWFRNILCDGVSGNVTGIVDWERARLNGTPGLDALHLAFMSLAMYRDRPVERYIDQAWTRAWESPQLADYVTRIQDAFGLNADDIGHLAAILCLDELHKIKSAGKQISTNKMASLRQLGASIATWLERQEASH